MLLPQTKDLKSRYHDKFELINDAFSYADMVKFHEFFIKNTVYYIGWADREDTKNRMYMHSYFTPQDFENLEFLKRIKNTRLLELIDGRLPDKVIVNITSPCYVFYPHIHQNQESLVYYANLVWPDEWSGETMVYEDGGKDILTCVPFVPGQVMWLKKEVVHALRPPSVLADCHRITLSCFFSNSKK